MMPVLAGWPLVVARQMGPDRFAYTGPWQVASLTGDSELRLAPNPHHAAATAVPPEAIPPFA